MLIIERTDSSPRSQPQFETELLAVNRPADRRHNSSCREAFGDQRILCVKPVSDQT